MTTTLLPDDTGTERGRLFTLLETIERRAAHSDATSRRNGWTESASVYPGNFTDDLLDLRMAATSDAATDSATEALRLIDEALRLHGRRPGVTTTHEVRTFGQRLRGINESSVG